MKIDRLVEKHLVKETVLPDRLVPGKAKTPTEASREMRDGKNPKALAMLKAMVPTVVDEMILSLMHMHQSSVYDMKEIRGIGKAVSNPYIIGYMMILDTENPAKGPIRMRAMMEIGKAAKPLLLALKNDKVADTYCAILADKIRKLKVLL